MDSTTRPTQMLHALTRDYPDLSRVIDQFWQGKGVDLPDWPAWCFLPMAAWYAIASHRLQQHRLDTNAVRDAQAAGGPGGTVRPHIRRAHWHGYWTGPREGTQTFVYHWLPPAHSRPTPAADE